jgi:lysophospholipase L1-like esterase
MARISPERFAGTWMTAMMRPPPAGPSTSMDDQTERAIVRSSIGGRALRVRLSNRYGDRPVTLAHVTVAERAAGASIVPGTCRGLTFAGERSVTLPAGAGAASDPVPFPLRPQRDLAISLAVRGGAGPATGHAVAFATSYLSDGGSGDHAADGSGDAFGTAIGSWLFVEGVDVLGDSSSVVALGDSITDGADSTFDANRRWPDVLARRLLALPEHRRMGVLNAGICGNRLLVDSPDFGVRALDRLDHDVLDQPGVGAVIVLLGINDIGHVPHQLDPDRIIDAHRQIVDRSHARGVTVIGGTLMPFKGTTIPDFYTVEGEATRQAVNRWIRTGGVFDGVIDFDRATHDPSDPLTLRQAFDSGDHLHPNDRGLEAMANAIDLALLDGHAV